MKTPGLSLTLGMSQGTKKPYARVAGRHSGIVVGKSLDLGSSKGLLLALAGLLVANAMKHMEEPSVDGMKDITPKKKPKKAKAPSVSLNAAQLLGGLFGK
jgi:hypothetical protein